MSDFTVYLDKQMGKNLSQIFDLQGSAKIVLSVKTR